MNKSIQIGKHKIRRSTKKDSFLLVEKLLEEAKALLRKLEKDQSKICDDRETLFYYDNKIESQKLLIHIIEAYLL